MCSDLSPDRDEDEDRGGELCVDTRSRAATPKSALAKAEVHAETRLRTDEDRGAEKAPRAERTVLIEVLNAQSAA